MLFWDRNIYDYSTINEPPEKVIHVLRAIRKCNQIGKTFLLRLYILIRKQVVTQSYYWNYLYSAIQLFWRSWVIFETNCKYYNAFCTSNCNELASLQHLCLLNLIFLIKCFNDNTGKKIWMWNSYNHNIELYPKQVTVWL